MSEKTETPEEKDNASHVEAEETVEVYSAPESMGTIETSAETETEIETEAELETETEIEAETELETETDLSSPSTSESSVAEHVLDPEGGGALAALPPRIVLYDGTCGLCHGVVRFLMDIDTHGAFHYAPLQGETTQQLRERGLEIPENLETVVFVEGDRAWLRSHAVFQAARYLPPPWRMIAMFRWIPRWLTDLAYRGVASIRYQMFGRKDLCEMPALDVRQRFLP